MSSSRSANTNMAPQKYSRGKPILRAFFLSFKKNVNYWLKNLAIFNLRFRLVHMKGYAQTVSITKTRNECIVTENSKLPVTDLLRMLLNGEMRNGEGGMVYGK